MEYHTGNTKDSNVYVHTTADDWSEPGMAGKVAPGFRNASRDQQHAGNPSSTSSLLNSFIARVVLAVVGAFLIMVGIPLLILPGPGLLAIGGGIACLTAAFKPRASQTNAVS